jgi:hypothetical protein
MLPRDVLLLFGSLPVAGMIALRLAAAAGLRAAPPSPEAFGSTLSLFVLTLLTYVALTLRALTRTAPELASSDADPSEESRPRPTRVTDFAIHLDRIERAGRIDLVDRRRAIVLCEEDSLESAPTAPAPGRNRILGELGSRLAVIPSSRQATAGRVPRT